MNCSFIDAFFCCLEVQTKLIQIVIWNCSISHFITSSYSITLSIFWRSGNAFKLEGMGVDRFLTSWIKDYLTERPQFVRLENCVSGTVRSSTGAPRETVLAPFLFTLYTADFQYISKSCHMQKYSDDRIFYNTVVACIGSGQEQEYRDLVDAFSDWCSKCCLLLNTAKTKEMVLDFRR